LLSIEDASGSDNESESEIISSSSKQKKKKQTTAAKVEDVMVNKGVAKKQGSKGKTDTKKPNDEDDIDELLAELDAPKSVKTVEKREKKKKKGGNVDDEVNKMDTDSHPNMSTASAEPEIDYRNMTQDEIARLMEEQYGEDSEEERKKAKSKKKKQKGKDDAKQMENIDKTGTETRNDEEKNADADTEVTGTVPKPVKKHNKKPAQKQTEVCIYSHLNC